MNVIQMHNNVPDIYNTSRDFQLLERLYDLTFNGSAFDSYTIEDITSTENIRTCLLSLLAKKLGFFTNQSFNDDELRKTLQAFPYLLKNKGTKKAIEEAVNVFADIKQIKSAPIVRIYTKSETDAYTVTVLLDVEKVDTTLLEEIFKYILPVGWLYKILFVKDFTKDPAYMSTGNFWQSFDLKQSAVVLSSDDTSEDSHYDFVQTADIRNSDIVGSYVQNIIIGAYDNGYVQGSDNESPSYLIDDGDLND